MVHGGVAGCKRGLWAKDGRMDLDGLKWNVQQWYGECHLVKRENCKCKDKPACGCADPGKQCTDSGCPCKKPKSQRERGEGVFALLQQFYQTVEWGEDGSCKVCVCVCVLLCTNTCCCCTVRERASSM